METKQTELHGISPKVTRLGIARHEAAHLMMLWLLDRPALFCMADDKGGATKQLKAPDAHKETILEHVLDSIAGMIGEWAPEVIAELKEHIRDINWFFEESDSHHIALGISYLDGDPEVWLCGFIEVTHRLLVKFSRPHREVTKLLLQKDVLDAVMIYILFEKWEAIYFHG